MGASLYSLGTNAAAARLELESASCNGISLRRRHFLARRAARRAR